MYVDFFKDRQVAKQKDIQKSKLNWISRTSMYWHDHWKPQKNLIYLMNAVVFDSMWSLIEYLEMLLTVL